MIALLLTRRAEKRPQLSAISRSSRAAITSTRQRSGGAELAILGGLGVGRFVHDHPEKLEPLAGLLADRCRALA